MGNKADKKRKIGAISPDELNLRLAELRKRARKAARGKGGARGAAAARRWHKLQQDGYKKSCCGKDPEQVCSSCPRHAAGLILSPLKT